MLSQDPQYPRHSRRELLAGISTLAFVLLTDGVDARTVKGALPWSPGAAAPPAEIQSGPWLFFTPEEASTVEALVDRLIPPDEKVPGGKDAGCAVFIDRQLAGPFGHASGRYMQPPFAAGTPQQGDQSPLTPAQRYRSCARRTRSAEPRKIRRQELCRDCCRRPGHADRRPGKRRGDNLMAPMARRSSKSFCRIPRKGSSPIRCTAAIATWRAGG